MDKITNEQLADITKAALRNLQYLHSLIEDGKDLTEAQEEEYFDLVVLLTERMLIEPDGCLMQSFDQEIEALIYKIENSI